jgi:hypothetical protein
VNDSTITCVNTANAADSQALPVRVELLDPGGATANGVTTPQGIGFQFDAQYQIGSFLDGQKWVVENTPGGGVQITAMTPNYSAGRNGWAENMRPFAQLTTGQSGCTANAGCQVNTLDDRVSGGGAEPEFIFIAPTTRYGSLPRTIPAGTSVLKVRSSSDSACASGGVGTARCITTASVLTVLASPPPANAMRPPFMGLQKPIFVTTGFNFATMLPSEALLGVSAQYTWPEITASFGDFAVQVPTAFIGEFDGRFLPSTMVSPRLADNISYGCDYGLWLMAGLLRLAQVGTAAEKGPAFYHLLQNAIDHYYATQDPGPRDKDWWGGGCSHHGRKALIMWGGRILAALPANGTGADAMAAFDNGEEAIDNMTYENGASLALWGLTPCSSGTPTCNGTARRCSADRDGGSKKLSNGTESCTVVQETPASQIASGIWSLGPYQLMADVYYGAATVARMYDFEDEWNAARADNSPAFFEYVDRIQGAPWNGACSGHCDQYLGEMYDAYAVP